MRQVVPRSEDSWYEIRCVEPLGVSYRSIQVESADVCRSGGLLSGNLKGKDEDAPVEKGGRYDPETEGGRVMRGMFLSGTEWEAYVYLESVFVCSDSTFSLSSCTQIRDKRKYDLTPAEVALRWLQHHSALTPIDFVVIGASKVQHVISNCIDSEKGPLPEEVVRAAEEAWIMAKARSSPYFDRFE